MGRQPQIGRVELLYLALDHYLMVAMLWQSLYEGKCQEGFIITCKRVVLAINVANFSQWLFNNRLAPQL